MTDTPALLLTRRHDTASATGGLPAHVIRVWISPLRREDLRLALLVACGRESPQPPVRGPRDQARPAPEPALSPEEAEAAGRLILVAEDNPVNQW